MANKSGATKEFRVSSKTSSPAARKTQTSVAYRTARVARERQKREIEQQKREKLVFALFVVVILVMILFAILVFKKVLGSEAPDPLPPDTTVATDPATDEGTSGVTEPVPQTLHAVTVAKSAVKSGVLVTVDQSHPFSGELPTLKVMSETRSTFGTSASGKPIYSYYVVSTTGTQLEETALEAFNKLADDFYKATANIDLYVEDAYAKEQSPHATGLCIALSFWAGGSDYSELDDAKYASDYSWLKSNFHKYGFIAEACAEHGFCYRYVGVPHAYYMYKNDLSIKNYIELVKSETLAFTTDSGDKYEVSYVKANGDVIKVELPSEDSVYEISGDNSNGLIVTVKTN